jgi:hypothetical protein
MKRNLFFTCLFLVCGSLYAFSEIRRPEPLIVSFSNPVITHLTAKYEDGKALLEWVINSNQLADFFEIEKSTDGGLQYSVTGIVFSSEQTGTEEYPFREKCTDPKTIYRIRITTKNKQTLYSKPVALQLSK